jgi:mono/diheme cytochrome c family protein
MQNRNSFLVLFVLAALAIAACESPSPPREEGYRKVAYQTRTGIPTPAAPNPPPVVAGIGAAGPAAAPAVPAGAPPQVTTASIEEGQRLYGTVCFACHGQNGIGTAAGPALNDTDWINIDGSFASLVDVIRDGVMQPRQYPGAMPPGGGGSFDQQQLEALAAYVLALAHGAQ